jgi:hypothetical protein
MGTNFTDDALLNEWYRYAAGQEGFVGSWLQMLRERQKITPEQQQRDFGASSQDFVRLQGMPLPRANQFTKDARRIAEVCHLANPSTFVQALLLVRSFKRSQPASDGDLEHTGSQFTARQSYQAAYDADEDLDQLPDEDRGA